MVTPATTIDADFRTTRTLQSPQRYKTKTSKRKLHTNHSGERMRQPRCVLVLQGPRCTSTLFVTTHGLLMISRVCDKTSTKGTIQNAGKQPSHSQRHTTHLPTNSSALPFRAVNRTTTELAKRFMDHRDHANYDNNNYYNYKNYYC
jgi:hypothetical protein